MSEPKRIAIFASGSGTNAENLVEYFKKSEKIEVGLIVTNNPEAGVVRKAVDHRVPMRVIKNQQLKDEVFIKALKNLEIEYILLAGFLRLIPKNMLKAFSKKIINIHPALLPKYGGEGMYGKHVHNAVLEAGDKESGITIHLVNEEYDKGEQIFQATCPVNKSDDAESLAKRVHELEYKHFPKVVEEYILNQK